MYTPKIENGDVVLDQSGRSTNLTGEDAAKQIVLNAALMWKNEWFLKPNDGIDWLSVMEKGRTITEIIQIITSGLVKNPYITKVVDLSLSVDKVDRKATIKYTVLIDSQNITGDITI
jgi:hypothetical protein